MKNNRLYKLLNVYFLQYYPKASQMKVNVYFYNINANNLLNIVWNSLFFYSVWNDDSFMVKLKKIILIVVIKSCE